MLIRHSAKHSRPDKSKSGPLLLHTEGTNFCTCDVHVCTKSGQAFKHGLSCWNQGSNLTLENSQNASDFDKLQVR